jgi:HK97 family phage portal protein
MNFRGAIATLFGGQKQRTGTAWREVGTYNSTFYPYQGDVYDNEVARASIHTLAEHTSKANAVVRQDAGLEKLLRIRPNLYMNGKDFLYKCRTLYEVNNTAFVYINRDERGKAVSFYPIPHCPGEAIESGGQLYIRFTFASGTKLTAAWSDLLVLRKHYNKSDIYGDTNQAIKTSLDLLSTTGQGMANAIKSTSNLRGILKSTKAMLSDDDVKKQKDRFVADYLSLENSSGIAMLDSTVDFKPVDVKPEIATYEHVGQLRENIYRYFGVSEDAIQGKLHGDAWEAFYDSAIEPFLVALGLELTYKVYSERQRGFGNEIVFESSRMNYMSMESKLSLVAMVDRGALTPDEWRAVLNLAPIEGGSVPLRRLDTATVGEGNTTGDATAEGELTGSETEQVVADAEDVAGKTLNGAQTQSLITVVSQYAAGSLTIGQAINIIAISIGISKEDAKKLLEGAVD